MFLTFNRYTCNAVEPMCASNAQSGPLRVIEDFDTVVTRWAVNGTDNLVTLFRRFDQPW